MKQFILSLPFLSIFMFGQLEAQEIANRVWTGVSTGSHDTIHIEFAINDTIYLEDSIHHDVPVATYEIVAEQLNFTDLGENSICGSVPATYNINLNGDSLIFKPVNDPCEDRKSLLSSYHWYPSQEKVHHKKRGGEISIYPSPYDLSVYLSLPVWFDRSEYRIFRLSQQLMKQGLITRQDPKIDVSDIPDGNYILFLAVNQQTYRLVIDQALTR